MCTVPAGQEHLLYPPQLLDIPSVKCLLESEVRINNHKEILFLTHTSKSTRFKLDPQHKIENHSRFASYKIIWAGKQLTNGNHLHLASTKALCSCFMTVLIPYSVDAVTTQSDDFRMWKFYLRTPENKYIPMLPLHWKSILAKLKPELETFKKILKDDKRALGLTLSGPVEGCSYYLPKSLFLAGLGDKVIKKQNLMLNLESNASASGLDQNYLNSAHHMREALRIFPDQPFLVEGKVLEPEDTNTASKKTKKKNTIVQTNTLLNSFQQQISSTMDSAIDFDDFEKTVPKKSIKPTEDSSDEEPTFTIKSKAKVSNAGSDSEREKPKAVKKAPPPKKENSSESEEEVKPPPKTVQKKRLVVPSDDDGSETDEKPVIKKKAEDQSSKKVDKKVEKREEPAKKVEKKEEPAKKVEKKKPTEEPAKKVVKKEQKSAALDDLDSFLGTEPVEPSPKKKKEADKKVTKKKKPQADEDSPAENAKKAAQKKRKEAATENGDSKPAPAKRPKSKASKQAIEIKTMKMLNTMCTSKASSVRSGSSKPINLIDLVSQYKTNEEKSDALADIIFKWASIMHNVMPASFKTSLFENPTYDFNPDPNDDSSYSAQDFVNFSRLSYCILGPRGADLDHHSKDSKDQGPTM